MVVNEMYTTIFVLLLRSRNRFEGRGGVYFGLFPLILFIPVLTHAHTHTEGGRENAT